MSAELKAEVERRRAVVDAVASSKVPEEMALLRELEDLRRERRNYKGAGAHWPHATRRHEDQIFEDLDKLRETQG